MKNMMTGVLIMIIGLFMGCGNDPDAVKGPVTVTKTNPMQVYMHYMVWFQSKPVSGYWGSHWKMNNKNPDIVDVNGKRQIAAHYYPLIGPYDSTDPDVIEYHLLLMKYAGVDGLLIDWYGSHNVYDYRVNLEGANATVDLTDDVGLKFAMVYEDYVAENVEKQTSKIALEAAQADMKYAQDNYFVKKEHISVNGAPLMMTFGPRFFKLSSLWGSVFEGMTTKPKFLPLWDHSGYVGSNGNGEFAWVDFDESLPNLEKFYKKAHLEILVGSAYPRFHDFYVEGGTGQSYGFVDSNNGETLRNTLAKAKSYDAKYLQLVTWNDFGEGTVIEPTEEDQFDFLETIQAFTGVSYGKAELELIHTYYMKKKEYKDDENAVAKLKEVFAHLTALEVEKARTLLEQL